MNTITQQAKKEAHIGAAQTMADCLRFGDIEPDSIEHKMMRATVELKWLDQALADPENQPSQFGTVPAAK